MSLRLFAKLFAAENAGTLTAGQLYEWNANNTALYNKLKVELDDLPAAKTPDGPGTMRHVYRTTADGNDVLIADVVSLVGAKKRQVTKLLEVALDDTEQAFFAKQHTGKVSDNATLFPEARRGDLVVVYASTRDFINEAGATADVILSKGAVPDSTIYRGFNGLVDLPAAMPVLVGTLARPSAGTDTKVTVDAFVIGGHLQPKAVQIDVPVYARMKVQTAIGGGAQTQKFIGDILTHALENGTNSGARAVVVENDGIRVGGMLDLAAWHATVTPTIFTGVQGVEYEKAVKSPFLQGYASGKSYRKRVLDAAIKSMAASGRASTTLASLKTLKTKLFGSSAAPKPPSTPLPAPVPVLVLKPGTSDADARVALEATNTLLRQQNAVLLAENTRLIARLQQSPVQQGSGGGGGGGSPARAPLTPQAEQVLAIQAQIKDVVAQIRALRNSGGAANAAKLAALNAHGQELHRQMDARQVV